MAFVIPPLQVLCAGAVPCGMVLPSHPPVENTDDCFLADNKAPLDILFRALERAAPAAGDPRHPASAAARDMPTGRRFPGQPPSYLRQLTAT